jgi:hypothetical protein
LRSWAWWFILIIPALKSRRKKDCKFEASLGYSKFQASVGYIVKTLTQKPQ